MPYYLGKEVAQPPPSPKRKRLSKRAKIVISLIVVASLVLGSIFLVFYSSHPDISSVQLLHWEPKWTGNEVNVVNPTLQEMLDPEYSLDSYIDITIKNPTQYQVFIKIHGQLNMTIIKNGKSVGNFPIVATQTFSISPYSEDVHTLSMPLNQGYPSGYPYLQSDNMTVTFNSYNISELYRGTTSPP